MGNTAWTILFSFLLYRTFRRQLDYRVKNHIVFNRATRAVTLIGGGTFCCLLCCWIKPSSPVLPNFQLFSSPKASAGWGEVYSKTSQAEPRNEKFISIGCKQQKLSYKCDAVKHVTCKIPNRDKFICVLLHTCGFGQLIICFSLLLVESAHWPETLKSHFTYSTVSKL